MKYLFGDLTSDLFVRPYKAEELIPGSIIVLALSKYALVQGTVIEFADQNGDIVIDCGAGRHLVVKVRPYRRSRDTG